METAYIIDDHTDTSHVMELFLQTEGFKTQCCLSYSEALEYIERNGPCCLFVDLNIPDKISIDEFLKRARKLSNAKVFIFSGDANIAQRASDLGADAYLTKPFEVQKLLEATAAHCPRRNQKT